MTYANDLKTKSVREPIFNKDMVQNSTGSFVFELGPFGRLERFLILGNEGGTYYSGQRQLTLENASCVNECLDLDPVKTVQTIAQISDSGRAIKNDPAIFALALCAASSSEAREFAYQALPSVCRIGTHLFQFVDAVNGLRGWGTGLKNAVSRWYTSRSVNSLARQVTKYAQRDGWSHRDVLRLCHANSSEHREVFDYVCQNEHWASNEFYGHPLLEAVHEAKTASENRIVKLIEEAGLEREHIPTEHLNSVKVWEALLPNLKQTALLRNLGKLTNIGLLKPLSSTSKEVADRLTDEEAIKRGRVHPFSILLAASTYKEGHGFRGKLTWTPDQKIVQALSDAFYLAFDAVEPTGKNFMFGVDVSHSMTQKIANTNVGCNVAAACLAMVSARTEPNTHVVGFCHQLRHFDITPQSSLSDVERMISRLQFGFTNPGLVIQDAIARNLEVDTFVTITDNEVNRGQHNTVLLEQYRQKTGRDARQIVVGMTATNFTIADPNDPRQLDIVGFDANGPAVISEFSR